MDTPPSPWTTWERNFATQMQRLREARKMTQTDLAKELQRFGLRFHQQTVQRVEAGERPVRLNEAYVIAQIFDVDLRSMTMSGSPADRDMLYAVDRLRRGSGGTAQAITEVLWEWIEDVESLGLAVSERLQISPDKPDEIARWGLAWVWKVLWTHEGFTNVMENLIQLEGEPARMHPEDPSEATIPTPDVIQAMREWIHRYGGRELTDAAMKEASELRAAFPGTEDDQKE
ncbi:helix-turn-helix transcriptional regulator [Actinomadura sp. 9N215]|uniref:helix-turn-helix transcriptional regulator n=1 Tax=Actinomadura sp. 9N215 TaxID=3375150 RepID=UPI00378D67A2